MLPQNCVLCLSSEPKCFLEVFCDSNEYPNKAVLIAKHLGIDLKLPKESFVCVDCWKSIFDFHLFYCTLKKLHDDEWTDPDATVYNTVPAQSNEDHQDFEFHQVGPVKAEPLDSPHEEDDHEGGELDSNSTNNNSTEHLNGRPKRNVVVPDRYNPDPCDTDDSDGIPPFSEHKFSESDEFRDYDALSSEKDQSNYENENVDGRNSPKNSDTTVEPPKRRRGRPPKAQRGRGQQAGMNDSICVEKSDDVQPQNDSSIDMAPSEPPKRKRGRPPKKAIDARVVVPSGAPTSEKRGRKRINYQQDSESDYEESVSLYARKKLGGTSSSKHKGKSIPSVNSPRVRDEKIFAYVDEFACHYCPEKVLFKRFSEAQRHYNTVHSERAFLKCPKCERKLHTSGMFVSHMETHVNPDKSKCEVCGKVTDSEVSLKKHMRIHQATLEQNFLFPCRKCSRRFEEESKRDKHEQLHVPKPVAHREYGRDESMLAFYKRIYCDVCEEAKPESTSFDNYWDLKMHMNKQHKKSPYMKCPICLMKMGTRHQIMMHIDVHKNPELYRCEVCKEIHQNLDRHMIHAHTPSTVPTVEKKSYNCERCGRIFRFRWKLKYHMNEAHGTKDLACDVCHKFFTRPGLAAHKRKAHVEGKATLLCDHCPKMYVTQHALRAHIAFAHENRRKLTKCNVCGKEIHSLRKHMQMVHPPEGPVSCDLCGKRFRAAFHMMRHRSNTCPATMASRPFKCEVCGKGFSLKLTMTEHMTTHTRTSLYQCAFCLKTYGYISNLQKHRKKAHPLEWQEVQGDQSIVTVIPLGT